MPDSIIKQLKVTRIIAETTNAKTFELEPVGGWEPQYKPGQFLTLVFYTNSGEKRRSYSISSCKAIGEPLAITVKKLDNGEFSRFLLYKVRVGDVLHTSGTGGFFTLPEDTSVKQYCFIAAGSGITPCFAMIKTLLATTTQQLYLFYSNRSEADTIFFDALTLLKKQYGSRLTIHFLFSNLLDIMQRRLSHFVLSQLLDSYLPAVERGNTMFYVCGPFEYMRMADISLKNNGVLSGQIIKEDFYPFPKINLPKPPDTDLHQVTMHLGYNEYTIGVQYPQNITAAAKAAHISVPYSCEAGRCGSCVARCTKGKIWMAYNEVLTDEEIAQGRVLTCQGFPVGGDAEIVFD